MPKVLQTDEFARWLESQRDAVARARILVRMNVWQTATPEMLRLLAKRQ